MRQHKYDTSFPVVKGAINDVTPAFLFMLALFEGFLPPRFQLATLKVALLQDLTTGTIWFFNFGFCNYGPLLLVNCLAYFFFSANTNKIGSFFIIQHNVYGSRITLLWRSHSCTGRSKIRSLPIWPKHYPKNVTLEYVQLCVCFSNIWMQSLACLDLGNFIPAVALVFVTLVFQGWQLLPCSENDTELI